ncbi:unnamed protein product [Merluccius merluccius]
MEAQQPMNTLAQMLAEVAAMNRDQAVLSRQQLAALQGQAERQTQLLETMPMASGGVPGRTKEMVDPVSTKALQGDYLLPVTVMVVHAPHLMPRIWRMLHGLQHVLNSLCFS